MTKRWDWTGVSDTTGPAELVRTLNTRMPRMSRALSALPSQHWFVPDAPNGHDDTAHIQEHLDRQNARGYGVVYLRDGQYKISTLEFYPGTVFRGEGFGGTNGAVGTWLNQVNGSTGAMLTPADPTVTTVSPIFEDFGLTAFANQASNAGGLNLEYCSYAEVHRVQCNYTNNYAYQVKAGTAAAGMHNSFTKCLVQNSADVAFLLTPTSTFAPDAVTLTDCTVNANNTWIKTEGSAYRGPDGLRVIGCNFIATDAVTALEHEGYGASFVGNRFETVGVGDAITVTITPTGVTAAGGTFVGNLWAAPGGVSWTDNGAIISQRFGDEFTGNLTRNLARTWGLVDGLTAPATLSGVAQLYVDTSDGDLKVVFGDGTVKTIVTDT